ncbi:MAG: hypothetical protein EHM79_10380 [Geobacter sp.]|nr:MAG: hypothetical protein EHM79_10380 [Geobacter sp.]
MRNIDFLPGKRKKDDLTDLKLGGVADSIYSLDLGNQALCLLCCHAEACRQNRINVVTGTYRIPYVLSLLPARTFHLRLGNRPGAAALRGRP